MKKVAYIIPGFAEAPSQMRYKKIASYFRQAGIEPVMVPIRWDKKKSLAAMPQFVSQFLKQFRKREGEEVYVLGYSFGAMIAFISAAQTKPHTLILCSLSPFFAEDFPALNKEHKEWVKNLPAKVKKYSFDTVARKVKGKTILIVGTKEPKIVMTRARQALAQIRGSRLVVSKGAKHKIAQREYQATLKKLISTL